ncbi:MAG TPA: lipase family protein [Flavobacterium sp.]|jgi:hypothetical protein
MRSIICFACLLACFTFQGQSLKPGFDKTEYIQLLRAFTRWGDSTYYAKITESKVYKKNNLKYRSDDMGLTNAWELYETPTHSVISIRGSTADTMSWIANFYAAMIPAQGQLQLNDSISFNYHFADHPQAAVHAGWTIASAYLLLDIIPKIKLQYAKGKRNFIIFGHSQGAAIGYYVTAQIKHYQKTGELPADIQLKTYCSAPPKPGNQYFAYDYEISTQFGWSISVVNPADWVPESPISIQTINDFNAESPFRRSKELIKKQPFPQNVLMSVMHNKLTKHNRKAVKKYKKFLGVVASKIVEKKLPGFEGPEFLDSSNYVRTGNMVILSPDEAYYKLFPKDDENMFVHHGAIAYIKLAEKL